MTIAPGSSRVICTGLLLSTAYSKAVGMSARKVAVCCVPECTFSILLPLSITTLCVKQASGVACLISSASTSSSLCMREIGSFEAVL